MISAYAAALQNNLRLRQITPGTICSKMAEAPSIVCPEVTFFTQASSLPRALVVESDDSRKHLCGLIFSTLSMFTSINIIVVNTKETCECMFMLPLFVPSAAVTFPRQLPAPLHRWPRRSLWSKLRSWQSTPSQCSTSSRKAQRLFATGGSGHILSGLARKYLLVIETIELGARVAGGGRRFQGRVLR